MRKLYYAVREHIREDFRLGYYLLIIGFLASIILTDQIVGIERGIRAHMDTIDRGLLYFVFYALVYFGACLITFVLTGWPDRKKMGPFLIMALVGIAVMAFDTSSYIARNGLKLLDTSPMLRSLTYQLLANFQGLLTTIAPLLIIAFFTLRGKRKWLGLHRENAVMKPYFIMLLMVFPLVVMSTFTDDFYRYYPTVVKYLPPGDDHPQWLYVSVYELFYLMDFVIVEFHFRGFFVVGLAMWLGRKAIIPIAVVYCVYHFGKPMGEVISSFLGGYLLGILAYRTQSIWGGIIAHIGLAAMMEVIAALQRWIADDL